MNLLQKHAPNDSTKLILEKKDAEIEDLHMKLQGCRDMEKRGFGLLLKHEMFLIDALHLLTNPVDANERITAVIDRAIKDFNSIEKIEEEIKRCQEWITDSSLDEKHTPKVSFKDSSSKHSGTKTKKRRKKSRKLSSISSYNLMSSFNASSRLDNSLEDREVCNMIEMIEKTKILPPPPCQIIEEQASREESARRSK